MRRHLSAQDLGLSVGPNDEAALFKWLLASMLFGHRIAQTIAARTWQVLVDRGCGTPQALARCPHAALVRMLGEGGYRRYDVSTARRLSRLGQRLVDEYDGQVHGIARAADGRVDFERRLLAFDGIGPVTLRIFMREAGPVLYGVHGAG
ncbi:DNA methylase [Luteimonas sp BLCC-B24]|uniref:DNA methylase n=1 Tax=Luteimonas sp. BLCC-B24 TaxID=3025317 RepID=UPI00234DD8C4|nr:DNA methylase [Luteimonas sp. BLCC-B24]MDC7807161.1 DNA methylase [Luteimonas sp. BLCC-B24]